MTKENQNLIIKIVAFIVIIFVVIYGIKEISRAIAISG